MHLVQGVTLLFTRAADQTTGMASMAFLLPAHGIAMGAMLIASAALTISALIIGPGRTTSLALMLPSEIGLVAGSLGRLHYIFAGHFSDGVDRPCQFIFVDQIGQPIFTLIFIVTAVRFAIEKP